MPARDQILDLKDRMAEDIIGQREIIERLLVGLLANGNLLVEGLPELAKTRAVKSLARHLDAELSRIQFTPDLLPPDVRRAVARKCRQRRRRPAHAPRAQPPG